ncbi:hypothetical protein NS506_02806 [Nocardia seriolae]|uniref:Arsenate reductase n=1 Tax=Nocardia seriolae TaxID=37332 RepID=A0ABC9Z3B6_9NOCA|nr:hypothetical protein [Nocardia seriolae]APA96866.1 hypothetical protein NS506_02806 [Nocardia seriolae]OJF82006.1 hypothetical protein NS14008_26095 [Nocardia seriolae]PSK28001.1 hypothetical protein C6575_28835 [Nocardia seriolae]QOW33909.1 hypothetical protein IMZ23_01755 [Nocardia seriolae]QUN18597.1 hypothetical protein KEC46_03980 [Nocardia seriolae]
MEPIHVEWVPDACTLPTAEQPLRVAEFEQLFTGAVLRHSRPGPTELALVLRAAAEARARDLAAREVECCSFFRFAFEPAGDEVAMRIEVPEDRAEVLDALESRLEDAPSP